MTLNEETKSAILKLQQKYPHKRSAIIPALHLAQGEKGYLCRKTQMEVAHLFDLEPNEVHAIVAFYDMFFDQPVGKHHLRVCKNVSCMLNGSDKILDNLCKKLEIEAGGTTADGEFTVIAAECLGACDKAPMMLADSRVIGPLKEEDFDTLIETIKTWPGNPSPISNTEGLS